MSDSDDTDILLLIPPNYYVTTAERAMDRQRAAEKSAQKLLDQRVKDHLRTTSSLGDSTTAYLKFPDDNRQCCGDGAGNGRPTGGYSFGDSNRDRDDINRAPTAPTTAAYQFLSPSKKIELNQINSHLQRLESDSEPTSYALPSDISTISNSTVRTRFGEQGHGDANGVIHSTPKSRKFSERLNEGRPSRRFLVEIDNFLEKHGNHYQQPQSLQHHHSDGDGIHQQQSLNTHEAQTSSLPSSLNRGVDAASSTDNGTAQGGPGLITLSEIFGKSGATTAVPASSVVREEQLRRQHLEKRVHCLQSQLLELEQRLSVAIEVDREKNVAIADGKMECQNLSDEIQTLRGKLSKLESEHKECTIKIDVFQRELAHAVSLATKFEKSSDTLQKQLAASTKQMNEKHRALKEEIDDLQLKLYGSKRSEELAIQEANKLKDKLAKAEHQLDKMHTRYEDLECRVNTLRQQKDTIYELQNKQKTRADALETQRNQLQATVDQLTANEATLKKKMDQQEKCLKYHYQQQLEQTVERKHEEFQKQLDKTEVRLRLETSERERILVDRAVKQMELINQKNATELSLIQEKHNEEIELYRLQLANASQKIEELEHKLGLIKSRRETIASELHDVMEVQWRKALDILVSPKSSRQNSPSPVSSEDDTTTGSHEENDTPLLLGRRKCDKGVMCDMPAKSPGPRPCNVQSTENNLNNPRNDLYGDRLQAYIEKLLRRSPSDFNRIEEVLNMSPRTQNNLLASDRDTSKSRRSKSLTRPPWKA